MTHRSSPRSFPRLGLGAIFTSLLGTMTMAGCDLVLDSDDSVGDCDLAEQIVTRQAEATEAELVAAGRAEDGTIPAAACPQLCGSGNAVSCRDLGLLGTSTGVGGAGGTGSGGSMGGAGGSGGGAGGTVSAGGASAGGASGDEAHRVECRIAEPTFCAGRRHAAVDGDLTASGPSEVAAWLARATASEAVSVPAFLTLRDELRALGAPEALVEAAERAAAEEVHHADVMRHFAERAGARPERGYAKAHPEPRPLLDLAIENAVEGCVNETFSGLMALHQARHAAASDFRAAMAAIADDEIGHGELAWAIHRWAITQLTATEVAQLTAAMHEAAARLVDAVAIEELMPAARAELGLPDGASATRLAASLRARLWS